MGYGPLRGERGIRMTFPSNDAADHADIIMCF
jgi:hypothetical protein